MRKTTMIMAIVVATALGGTGLYLSTREHPVATEELSEALLATPSDASALTAIFSRVLTSDMDLRDRQATLEENGFRCSIEAANVEGSRYLRCLRPTRNTSYCQGIKYYAYETLDGEIIETLGSAYDASGDRNVLGQCTGPRDEYLTGRVSAD